MSSNLIPLLNHSICISTIIILGFRQFFAYISPSSYHEDNFFSFNRFFLLGKIFIESIHFKSSRTFRNSFHRKLNSIRVSFVIWFHLSTGWYNFKKFSKWFSRWRIESRFKQKKFNSLSSQFQDSLHCDSKVILAKLRDAIQ